MKRLALFPVLVLLGALSLPGSAWATGDTSTTFPMDSSGLTGRGDDDYGGGTVGFNDIRAPRTLTWKREWSTDLIDTWNLIDTNGGESWCQGSTNIGIPLEEIEETAAYKGFVEETKESLPDGGSKAWRFVPIDANGRDGARVLTGTCASPMAVWGRGGSGQDHSPRYGRPSNGAHMDTPSEAGQRKAFQTLKSIADDIGLSNTCDVKSTVRDNPNASGCDSNPQKANGGGSWSEQIPTHPDSISSLRKPGYPNTAVVRVWRECAHKYVPADQVPTGAQIKPVEPHKYEDDSDSCSNKPILERSMPVMSPGQQDCPDSTAPFHGTWDRLKYDRYCPAGVNNSVFNARIGTSGSLDNKYASTGNKNDNAFGTNVDASEPAGGPLFGNCLSPEGAGRVSGMSKASQQRYCRSGRKGNSSVGRASANNADVPDGQQFKGQCKNGPISQGPTWKWVDYAGQLAELLIPSGGESLAAFTSANDSKVKKILREQLGREPEPIEVSEYHRERLNDFMRLFVWWNPVFYNQLTKSKSAGGDFGLPGATVTAMGINRGSGASGDDPPEGLWPAEGITSYLTHKSDGSGLVPGHPLVNSLVSGSFPRNYRHVACNLFNEWISLGWTLDTSGQADVKVNLQPIPNRLYVVQVALLDQRENIVSESMQLIGGPASGQLPSPESSSTCKNPRTGQTYNLNADGTKPAACGSSDKYCYKFQPLYDNNYSSADIVYYNEGDPLPADCQGTINSTDYSLSPAPFPLQTEQPASQLLGQTWAIPGAETNKLGKISSMPSNTSRSSLPEGTPTPTRPPIADTGLWLPRSLKVSIFNPEIWRCGSSGNRRSECQGASHSAGQKALYSDRHRILAQSDIGTSTVTSGRFDLASDKLLTERPEGVSASAPMNPGSIPGTSWLQGTLPLLYAEDGSNLFYNSWTVGVNSPTRAPQEDEDLTALATSLAASAGLSWGSLSADQQQSYLQWAANKRRADVDESRFTTLLGEGRSRYQIATASQQCQTIPNETRYSCNENAAVESKWRRLTSDKCPVDGQSYRGKGSNLFKWAKGPKISIDNATPGDCNESASVGSGWKVSDAYKLPEIPGPSSNNVLKVTELSSVFRVDGDGQAPAHLELDAPDIPASRILGVDIWSADSYYQRASRLRDPSDPNIDATTASPIFTTATLTDANPEKGIHLCKPIDPYYVWTKFDWGIHPTAKHTRTVSHFPKSEVEWLNGILEYDSTPTTDSEGTVWGGGPSQATGNYMLDNGYNESPRGSWWVLKPGLNISNVNYQYGIAARDAAGDQNPVGRALWSMYVAQSEGDGWRVQQMPDGRPAVWVKPATRAEEDNGLWHPMHKLREAAKQNTADWAGANTAEIFDRYWNGYLTAYNDWEKVADGDVWWWNDQGDVRGWPGLEQDVLDARLHEKVDQQRYYEDWALGKDVGECTDLENTKPNARLMKPPNAADDPGSASKLEFGYGDNIVDNELQLTDTGEIMYSPRLPAGDYVVSFRVAGPIKPPSGQKTVDWGIRGLYAESNNTVWLNNFDLQQKESQTAIYRLRPTG